MSIDFSIVSLPRLEYGAKNADTLQKHCQAHRMKNDYNFDFKSHPCRLLEGDGELHIYLRQLITMNHEPQKAINSLSRWIVMCFMRFLGWQHFKCEFYVGVELSRAAFECEKLIDWSNESDSWEAINQTTLKRSIRGLNLPSCSVLPQLKVLGNEKSIMIFHRVVQS